MIDVLLFCDSAERGAALARQLKQGRGAHRLCVVECAAGELERHAPQTVNQDLLIAALAGMTALDMVALARLAQRSPQTVCLLIVDGPSTELLVNAMRAGIRHVLTWPLQDETLRAELASIEAALRARQQRAGRVLSFVSARGGSGASLVAANFADACAAASQQRTLLLDLNRQYADACLYLQDQTPSATLMDLIPQIARLDTALFDACVAHLSANLHVLPGAGDPIKATQLQPEHLQQILHYAQPVYDAIVIDIGTHLDPLVIAALDHSHAILPVTQQSLPHLAAGRRLLGILQELGYSQPQIKLLVNRYDKHAAITLRTVQDMLGIESASTLANDSKLAAQAANQGRALRGIAPTSALSQQIAALAAQYFPPAMPQAGQGLLRRLSRNLFKPKTPP